MSRHFILTLTLIVLIAMASAGWLGLGAIAGEEDIVLSASPSDRVFYEDASEVESNDLFTTVSEENQEQAAFDDFAPSAEYESNEFAEIDPFVANEQAENPFAADPTAEHDAESSSPKSPTRQQVLQEQVEKMQRQAAELMEIGLPTISEQIRANAEKLATSKGYVKINNELIREANGIANLNVVKLHGIEKLLNLEKEAKELAAQGKTEELENLQDVYITLKAIVEGQLDYRRHPFRLQATQSAVKLDGVDQKMLESLDNSLESDQLIRNEVKVLLIKLDDEAQMIGTLIERDPKILDLRNEAEKLDDIISKHEETPKDPQSSLVLKSLQQAREKLEKTIKNRRRELRPLLKKKMHTQFAAGERLSKYQKYLEQRAREQNDQTKSMRFIERMETEKNRHANAGPEERKIQRKIEHLQRAIENLKQAGLEKQAQELEHQITRMQVELRTLRRLREIEKRERLQRHERDHAPRDNVHEALNDLRHEIRNLRNEVREMHELLEQHVKRRGKSKVELIPRNIEIEVEEELRPYDKSNIKKRGDQRIEIEEIDTQARDEEEFEEEHEERPPPTPDYELPPINQPEQIEEEAEALPSEGEPLPVTETKVHEISSSALAASNHDADAHDFIPRGITDGARSRIGCRFLSPAKDVPCNMFPCAADYSPYS